VGTLYHLRPGVPDWHENIAQSVSAMSVVPDGITDLMSKIQFLHVTLGLQKINKTTI